jgi:hypothetical protein
VRRALSNLSPEKEVDRTRWPGTEFSDAIFDLGASRLVDVDSIMSRIGGCSDNSLSTGVDGHGSDVVVSETTEEAVSGQRFGASARSDHRIRAICQPTGDEVRTDTTPPLVAGTCCGCWSAKSKRRRN